MSEEMSTQWIETERNDGTTEKVKFISAKGRPASHEPGWLQLQDQITVGLECDGEASVATFYRKAVPSGPERVRWIWINGEDYSEAQHNLSNLLDNMFHVWEHKVKYKPAEGEAK